MTQPSHSVSSWRLSMSPEILFQSPMVRRLKRKHDLSITVAIYSFESVWVRYFISTCCSFVSFTNLYNEVFYFHFWKANYILGHLEGCWIDHWFLSLILYSILAFFLSFSFCLLLISCSLPALLLYFHHFYFVPYILSLPINLSPLPLSSFFFFLLSSSIYIFRLSSYFFLYSPILQKYNIHYCNEL